MSTVTPTTWHRIISQHGVEAHEQGTLEEDPFALLARRATDSDNVHGQVAMTLGNSTNYAQIKVSITLTIPVAMTEQDISLAGEAAFIKLHQMVNEASDALGIPALE